MGLLFAGVGVGEKIDLGSLQCEEIYLEKRFDFRNKEDKATKQKVLVCAITCF